MSRTKEISFTQEWTLYLRGNARSRVDYQLRTGQYALNVRPKNVPGMKIFHG